MPVQQKNLFKAVIGERFGHVENAVDKVLEMAVDGAREIHDVAAIAVPVGRQHQHFVGNLLADSKGDALRTDDVHVQGQVRSMLLHGTAGQNADFTKVNRVVD